MSDDADDVAELTPEDDAAVTAVLAALPQPVMPEDVAARLAEALAAEPPWSGDVPAWAAGGSDNVTVLPSAQERQRRGTHRLRLLTGVAASIVAVVGVVALGANTFSGDDSGGGAGTAGGALPESTPTGALLTTSGTTYSVADLDTQVTGLVSAADVAGAPLTTLPPSVEPDDASVSPSISPTPSSRITSSKDLITNLLALGVCLRKLDRAGEQPIAADAGTWSGQQAVVLVLDGSQVSRVDVYVVAPACGDQTDPADHMLYYGTVTSTR